MTSLDLIARDAGAVVKGAAGRGRQAFRDAAALAAKEGHETREVSGGRSALIVIADWATRPGAARLCGVFRRASKGRRRGAVLRGIGGGPRLRGVAETFVHGASGPRRRAEETEGEA